VAVPPFRNRMQRAAQPAETPGHVSCSQEHHCTAVQYSLQ
jgi:hypothetical protein